MKPNGYKKTITPTMLNKNYGYLMVGLGLGLYGALADADELLGHISDDTEPKTALSSPADENANSDRKIIYRVICSPADEQLPDCEKPFHDVESETKPQLAEEVSEQPKDVDQAESATDDKPEKPAQTVKPAVKDSQKTKAAGKKQPDSKKSKAAAKNPPNKKGVKKTLTKPTVNKTPAKKK